MLLGNRIEEITSSWAKHCEPFVLIRLFSHSVRVIRSDTIAFWGCITHMGFETTTTATKMCSSTICLRFSLPLVEQNAND